jgi:uncharacterized repeat protein (TIGR01451 family)
VSPSRHRRRLLLTPVFLVVLAMYGLGVPSAEAQASPITVGLASGADAVSYTVTAGPGAGASGGAVAFDGSNCPEAGDGVTYGSITGATWIFPDVSEGTATCEQNDGVAADTAPTDAATTHYTATFTLPDGFASPSIDGSFLADNVGTVLLNGNTLAAQDATGCNIGGCPTGNFKTSTPFTSTDGSQFVAGDNTLEFVVDDYGVATGLDFAATVTYSMPDLSLTDGISLDAAPIAGTNEKVHVTVSNVGAAASGGYTFTAPLPSSTTFTDADATNQTSHCTLDAESDPNVITCDRSSVTVSADGTDTFDFVIGIDAGFTDPIDTASLNVDGTITPSGPDASSENDNGTGNVDVTAQADLEISKSVTTPVTTPANTAYANADDTKNLVTYTITLVNHGASNAHDVTIDDSISTNLTNASYCQVPAESSTCTPDTAFTGSVGGEGTTLEPGTYQWVVTAHAKSSLRDGQLTNHNTASVSSTTEPYGQATNSRTSSDVTNYIDTVPGIPTINLATAGNAKVGLNWSAPATDGGTPITSYTVYASPCPTTGPNPCAVLSGLSPAPNASGNTFSYFVTGLTNNTAYTFTVRATNDVGEGDPQTTGATVTPNVSADTNKIVNNVGSVDTGFSGGAQGCATGVPSTDPRCKDIVGKWSLTDAKDNGQLVGLSAIPNNPAQGGPGIDCLEFDFATNSIADGGECVGATQSDPFGKATLSTFPTNQTTLSVPHVEYSQYDASITTSVLGAPCTAIKTVNGNAVVVSTPDGPEPICTNPAFPNVTGRQTNICPEDTGWTKAHPCAYIYYDVMQIPGYDLTGNRPVACTTGASCGAPFIIGSTVQAGIKTGGMPRIRPWCTGKFPNFTALPCVFKAMWLNKSTGNGNNDIQWQEYVTGDPGTLKTG